MPIFDGAPMPRHVAASQTGEQSEQHAVNKNRDSVKTFRDKKHRL